MPFLDFSPSQLLIVLIVGLIVFGPKRLPEMTKQLGKGVRDFQKGLDGVMDPSSEPAAEAATATAAAASPAAEPAAQATTTAAEPAAGSATAAAAPPAE